MGYVSYLEGTVDFSRTLNRVETEAVAAAQDKNWAYYELLTERTETETDDGVLTIVRTLGLQVIDEGESSKAYEWENALRAMINALPVDVTAVGYIERHGEDSSDMERLYVYGREVRSVEPQIIWTDPFLSEGERG